MKRSTIAKEWGQPHDAVIPQIQQPPRTNGDPAAGKSRITFVLADEVADRLRDAVYWTPGANLSGFVEQAITEAIERVEKKRGEAFVKRPGQLRAGRPVKLAG